mmetsp:Transcript_70054/g.123817  ORF Transcript_70054/g.123817 Transcript_70054/m.123817 type:complete len:522 (+) Transcript_70054:22-1587(+)|eukprot:CAMPEP_0197629420 /NCGR_PEP_ID=MMETSP1338-20131121/7276_1 /TAXON_ID=43686 ORGANISM="Pelagodinium beii, Strain RCC1491" /NCGR_SAMPLE_ID=MMETSP1338 /ASSEMBLY_ACC=CAM_ASM_000754 /LENGTH=521 /DNA_ID=CAMNT_0043200457 /DNA_START=22 /DNA_END=1587 /DNA_ORIENTATION=+
MSADLIDWISRQGQVSGDARQDLIRHVRRLGWDFPDFAAIIASPALHKELAGACNGKEIAVLSRAWRTDFGDAPQSRPPERKGISDLSERQHYVGGGDHMYSLDGYAPNDGNDKQEQNGRPVMVEAWTEPKDQPAAHRKAHKDLPAEAEIEVAADEPSKQPFLVEQEKLRDPGAAGLPGPDASEERRQRPRQAWMEADYVMQGPTAIAASPDGSAVFMASRGGLARFSLPDIQLCASAVYAGLADPPGYADIAAGDGFVVCADVNGCLYRHDDVTCELEAKMEYQPSVMEHAQRIVASHLQRRSSPLVGLEGGFGGASRLAVGGRSVYLGGRDGVVTSYSAGSLNVMARYRLLEVPASVTIGVRSLFFARSQRLYCAVQSSVHVLRTPSMQQVARLRGGPRVPVFGNVSCAIESSSGELAFVADVGGPSIHIWKTSNWQWLTRVELPQGGGPACHLTIDPSDEVLYAGTDCSRFIAFDFSRAGAPMCIAEGAGGGPMVVVPAPLEQILVLTDGALRARKLL